MNTLYLILYASPYFIILFLIGQTAFSQEKGLLFEISGNNIQKPSYIFGTMHLLCEGDFEMSEEMISKIKSSEVLAMEWILMIQR
jgi:uncharacterized protein